VVVRLRPSSRGGRAVQPGTRGHIGATSHRRIADNNGHWRSANVPVQRLHSASITAHPTARVLSRTEEASFRPGRRAGSDTTVPGEPAPSTWRGRPTAGPDPRMRRSGLRRTGVGGRSPKLMAVQEGRAVSSLDHRYRIWELPAQCVSQTTLIRSDLRCILRRLN